MTLNLPSDVGHGAMRARLESPRRNSATSGAHIGTTRAARRRQLPTKRCHAALLFGVTRAYQPDSSSKPLHRQPCARVLGSLPQRRPQHRRRRHKPLDGRSFHISYGDRRAMQARARRMRPAGGDSGRHGEIARAATAAWPRRGVALADFAVDSKPRWNQRTRCAEEPCVKLSGTTRPSCRRCRRVVADGGGGAAALLRRRPAPACRASLSACCAQTPAKQSACSSSRTESALRLRRARRAARGRRPCRRCRAGSARDGRPRGRSRRPGRSRRARRSDARSSSKKEVEIDLVIAGQ